MRYLLNIFGCGVCLAFLLGLTIGLKSAQAEFVNSESAAGVTTSSASQKLRAYPGGKDEEDLKAQEELKSPTTLVDRRSVELKVLKSYFKNADMDSSSDTNAKTSEKPTGNAAGKNN
jgi:hypothetical protein